MTSDTVIVTLLTATALLLAIGWLAVIVGVLLTVRRVHSVLRRIELTAESIRSSASGGYARRPLWQAARTLYEFNKRRQRSSKV